MNLKIEAARRQLGMALDLYIRDLDPVSVHCLACGGAEVIEHFVSDEAGGALSTLLMQQNPGLDIGKLRKLQRLHWNAFKHATGKREGSAVREDEELLLSFHDGLNDPPLFIGWVDYGNAVGGMPIEAQVYVAWYLAKYPNGEADGPILRPLNSMFPGLAGKTRTRQKAALVKGIQNARKNKEVMQNAKTEHRPLVLGWPQN